MLAESGSGDGTEKDTSRRVDGVRCSARDNGPQPLNRQRLSFGSNPTGNVGSSVQLQAGSSVALVTFDFIGHKRGTGRKTPDRYLQTMYI